MILLLSGNIVAKRPQNIRGRLPNFISHFLKDKYFKVRVGSTFSDSHPQEMDVPQVSSCQ